MARIGWQGVFPAVTTQFHEDLSLDLAATRRQIDHLLSDGVDGLILCGTVGEGTSLTASEKRATVEMAVDVARGRVPVVVGCSDPSPLNVVDYARHAEAVGADLVMVWPPYYGPRTPAGVRAFYEYVAARIGIGMVAYSTTLSELGYYLAPEQVEALLHLPQLCAVQDTTLNFTSYARMMERVGDRIAVSTSLEEYFLFGRLAFPDRALSVDDLLGPP